MGNVQLRAAQWVAVSRKEQLRGDKFSIPNQLRDTEAFIYGRGWKFSVEPYVVPGQSRTKYIQLDQAIAEMDAMRDMIQDARLGKFDILVMTEFDRMRDLLDQVFRTLAQYRVQLYSIAQPVEPVPPSEYSVYKADSIVMNISVSQMTSRLEISRTRRKWNENMPRRITDLGLPATHISFGYRKPAGQLFDRKAIPEQDPAICEHILAIKDLFMAGHSTTELIDYLEEHQVLPPKGDIWYPQTVRDILRNPFYAGLVQFGASRVYIDPLTDKRKRNRKPPADQIETGKGRHVPLWDEETREAILLEMQRRSINYKGRVSNEFTGLVKCWCGAPMWRHSNGPRGEYRLVWRCSTSGSGTGHNMIYHEILKEKVITHLEQDMKTHLGNGSKPSPKQEISMSLTDQAIAELTDKLTRLEDAYLAGQWDLTRFTQRKAELEEKLDDERKRKLRYEKQQMNRKLLVNELEFMKEMDDIRAWFANTSPVEINKSLHILLDRIIIGKEVIELEFKL